MRAIDADAIVVHKFPSEDYDPSENDTEKAYRKGWNDALDAVAEFQPSAEPVRNGKWCITPDGKLVCSCCHENPTNRIIVDGNLIYDMTPIRKRMKFCPNCGASMSEGEEE